MRGLLRVESDAGGSCSAMSARDLFCGVLAGVRRPARGLPGLRSPPLAGIPYTLTRYTDRQSAWPPKMGISRFRFLPPPGASSSAADPTTGREKPHWKNFPLARTIRTHPPWRSDALEAPSSSFRSVGVGSGPANGGE
ncbi:hypothetical protein ACHAWF_010571 [Thalassiosira exigua]